ncbi:MAG: PAS domain-containing protein [Spirochaetales bacterium]|nr:PAS domain-containing protein [Spirochaetales bacterium]
MRRFIARALDKLPKLDKEQIHNLITDLAMENDLLEVVLDSLTDGVVVLDKEYRVIFLNKAAERQLPYMTSDPYEKPLWDVLIDEEIAGFLEDYLQNDSGVDDHEFTYGTGMGNRTMAYSIMPLVKRKAVEGRVLHIEDVTAKRQEQARLHRAESLASLTTLAAGVAHEIKNPLASIGIHIQIMQKELDMRATVDKDGFRSYLSIVNEEIERLNGIVVDFLFAVRPMDIQAHPSNVNNLVSDLVEFVHYELDEKGISVITDLDTTIPWIRLDEKYIKQALLNLIKNAEAAMAEGGVLKIATWMEDESVCLAIIDNGVGIPAENLSKIFEPYFTTKDFGSGLGLTLVYKIIKEHGGDVSIKSKENEGTTFTFRFPVSRQDRKQLKEYCEEDCEEDCDDEISDSDC